MLSCFAFLCTFCSLRAGRVGSRRRWQTAERGRGSKRQRETDCRPDKTDTVLFSVGLGEPENLKWLILCSRLLYQVPSMSARMLAVLVLLSAAPILTQKLPSSLNDQEVAGSLSEVELTANLPQLLHEVSEFIRHLASMTAGQPGWQERVTTEVQQMVQEVKQTHKIGTRSRRGASDNSRSAHDQEKSLTRDQTGIYFLHGIENKFMTTAKYPTDINIFSLQTKARAEPEWYAVTLESNNALQNYANEMVIYKYNIADGHFARELSRPVLGGVDVEVFEIFGHQHLVVAEYEAGRRHLEGSTVYKVIHYNGKILLEPMQTLNTNFPQDITVWEHMNQVFLAVAQGSDNSLVYRWLGQHFDLISTLHTSDARSVQHFNIGSSTFLAFANHKDKLNNTEVYSEIFKYNLNDDNFESHQKIKTYGAMDIKVFCFEQDRVSEKFMIIANTYENDDDGNEDYHTYSTIYKLVDKFFTPFQSIHIPAVTHWEPVVGDRGQFVLLAASKLHGVQAVQYSGWRFLTTGLRLLEEELEENITAIRSLQLHGKKVVAIASKKNSGSVADVLEFNFQHSNMLGSIHDSLQTWCEASLAQVNQSNVHEVLYRLEQAPKSGSSLIELSGNVSFTALTVGELSTNELETKDGSLSKGTIDKLNSLHHDLTQLMYDADNLTEVAVNSPHTNDEMIVEGNLEFTSLEFACSENCSFKDVHIKHLNGENFDKFMHQTVDIRKNLDYTGALEFDHVIVQNELTKVQSINEVKFDNLIVTTDNLKLGHPLTINGRVTLDAGAVVEGHTLGLDHSAVVENDTLIIRDLRVKNINTNLLNEIPVTKSAAREAQEIHIRHIRKADVQNLAVEGLISGINFTDFVRNSLKNSGNHMLTGLFSFENLEVQEGCRVKSLMSGIRVPEELVLTNKGQGQVSELRFHSVLSAQQIVVRQVLNDIGVSEGQLQVLQRASLQPQLVTGHKTLRQLHLTERASINGTFNGAPVKTAASTTTVTIDKDIIFKGDELLRGKVFVDGVVYADDILGDNHSISHLLSHGLLLTEPKIPITLEISQVPSQVVWLTAEQINEAYPSDWLRSSSPAVVRGEKVITGDLYLSRPVFVWGLVNEVNVTELDRDLLRTTGDQEVTGHKTFSVISVDSANAEKAWIGETDWSNVLKTSGDQKIHGLKIVSTSVFVQGELEVDEMKVDGKTAGIDLQEMFADSISRDDIGSSETSFQGNKQFQNVIISEEIVAAQDTNQLLTSFSDNVLFVGDKVFNGPVTIERIVYKGLIDSVSHTDLGQAWLLSEGDQTLRGQQTVHEVEARGSCRTRSGLVNDFSVGMLETEAVYIDQNSAIKSVTFENAVYCQENLKLDGQLQEVDFSQLVLDNENAEITASKTFLGPVQIDELNSTRPLTGLNLHEMCQLVYEDHLGAVKIKGAVFSTNEPSVTEFINNYEVSGLQDLLWYKDKDAVLTGHVEFGDLTLEGKVDVQGLVDGVSLKWLSENYFSKSVKQHITGDMAVQFATFKHDLYAHRGFVGGQVGNIHIENFVRRVLRDGPKQSIFGYMVFNKIYTKGDVELHGLLNDVDLSQDVMLLSRGQSEVLGRTTVEGINCKYLKLSDSVTIQDVNITDWVKKAVRTTGNYSVKGLKKFFGSEFKTLRVAGFVDGRPFSQQNIMVQGLDQQVTGQKSFATTSGPALVTTYLTLRKLLNGLDFGTMCSRIAFKDGTLVIEAYKNFTAGMSVEDSVHMSGLYHGVNVTSLHPRLLVTQHQESRQAMHNVTASYHQILESARLVDQSLEGQAVYLSHYQVVHTVVGPVEVMCAIYLGDTEVLLAVVSTLSSTHVSVAVLQWNVKAGRFMESGAHKHKIMPRPYYVYQEKYGNFVLTCSPEILKDKMSKDYLKNLDLWSGRKLLALNLKGHECLLTYKPHFNTSIQIFCGQQGSTQELYQELPSTNPIQYAVARMGDMLHLVLVQGETPGFESSVEVWKLQGDKFVPHQAIDVVNAVAVATVSYRGHTLLAIASGMVKEAVHHGNIYLLNLVDGLFRPWSELAVNGPTALKFSTLPSGELVLYVLSSDAARPLSVFLHRGEQGFQEYVHATTLAVPHDLGTLTLGQTHLVTLAGDKESNVLEAVLKGNLS